MPEYVTKSDFAKQMGVRPSAVTNALKRGAITTVLVNGREMIEPVAARAQWEEYSRPYRRAARAAPTANVDARLHLQPAATSANPPREVGEDATLHEVRTKRERHEANIAEMREKQLAGSLVDRERVRAVALRSGRLIRDTVLGVPTRIAHDLLGLTDPWEAQRRLEDALRQALADAAKIHLADLEGVLTDGR